MAGELAMIGIYNLGFYFSHLRICYDLFIQKKAYCISSEFTVFVEDDM